MMPPRIHDANRRRSRARAIPSILVAIGAAGGCALTEHTIDPYRSDPAAAARIEARAATSCEAMRIAAGRSPTPVRPFRTDGCSAWPDTEATQPCCVEHDIAYWCGGTSEERLTADDAFGRCVAARADSPTLGALMRAGVRLGGHPFFPMPYRWGYGDPYSAGYPALDPPARR